MGRLKIDGVTHWSIPVNDLEESERFYRDLLGLTHVGRLGDSGMSCFNVGDHNILLCERGPSVDRTFIEERRFHHAFTVSPDTLVEACKAFSEEGVLVEILIYRTEGYFRGRELYFFDPSGNRLELRDPTWEPGMPEPTLEQLVAS